MASAVVVVEVDEEVVDAGDTLSAFCASGTSQLLLNGGNTKLFPAS